MKQQTVSSHTLAGCCGYLVRLWQDNSNGDWRASAQSVQGGETTRFADLEQLFVFLRRQTTKPPPDESIGE